MRRTYMVKLREFLLTAFGNIWAIIEALADAKSDNERLNYGIDAALRRRKEARDLLCDPARRAAKTRVKR